MERGKVALGVLGGVAAGALLGVLFAPDKGSKTRRKILDKGKDYSENLKKQFEEVTDSISEKYDSFIAEAKELATPKK